jgi:hypothetical protein
MVVSGDAVETLPTVHQVSVEYDRLRTLLVDPPDERASVTGLQTA